MRGFAGSTYALHPHVLIEQQLDDQPRCIGYSRCFLCTDHGRPYTSTDEKGFGRRRKKHIWQHFFCFCSCCCETPEVQLAVQKFDTLHAIYEDSIIETDLDYHHHQRVAKLSLSSLLAKESRCITKGPFGAARGKSVFQV